MTLLERWNRRTEALSVARDYLRRFPRGTYATCGARAGSIVDRGAVKRPSRGLLDLPQRTGWLFLLVMLGWSRAFAETAPATDTVILLQPTTASLAARRSLARIRDELVADRFHVVIADSTAAGTPEAVIETAAREAGRGAVIALFGDPDTDQAELCVVQQAAGRAVVRRATVVVDDPERMPEALAARALELLRATALELSIENERAPRRQEQPEVLREAAPPTSSSQPSSASETIVAIDLGVGTWASIEGPPPAVVPVGRIALRLSDWIWARVTAAGLGTRPRVETAYGSATLAQTVALAEAVAVFRGDKRLRPIVSLGAGVLNVAVNGIGAATYEGRAPQQWSAAFDGGVGVALALRSRAALVTELHAMVATPHPVVRFADTRAATIGYPSLILTLSLQVAP